MDNARLTRQIKDLQTAIAKEEENYNGAVAKPAKQTLILSN